MRRVIHVGPIPYSVHVQEKILDGDNKTELDGHVRTSEQTITIKSGYPIQYTTALALHEIVHAVLIQAGQRKYSHNEGLIDAIAYGLTGTRIGDEPLLNNLIQLVEEVK